MVGIGYLLGGGFEPREGVPAIQGCLRGVKWTLSVLRTAVGNSSLFRHVVPAFIKRWLCALRRYRYEVDILL